MSAKQRKDATSKAATVPTSDTESKSTSQQKTTKTKSSTSPPLLYRVLTWGQKLVQFAVLLLLAAFVVNWLISTWQLAAIRRDLASDSRIRLVSVKSANAPLSVRCDVSGQRRASIFVIPGAGGSWLFNTLPLWAVPKVLGGIEMCSFARQGLPFTDGWPDNSTAVDAITNQVVELITELTDASQPLWIIGHSYGGVQAPLVAHKLLSAHKRKAHGVLIFDPAPLFDNAKDQVEAVALFESLARRVRFAEVLSSLGVMRAMLSKVTEQGVIANMLHEVPHTYRDAFLYALTSQQTYKGISADLERLNATTDALRALIVAEKKALLGDIPVDLVYASYPRNDPVDEVFEQLLLRHDANSLYDGLSTATRRVTIAGADHMFHSNDETILKTLNIVVAAVAPTLTVLRQAAK